MQFKQVLFPFDYSERCRHAACFVKALLDKFGAQLTIVNVLEDPAAHHPASLAFAVSSVEQRKLIEHSTTFLQNYARGAFPPCSVQAVCRMGDPAKEIIEVASDMHANLIMMPTRGCGRLRTFLLGSVTAKVLDDAKCPVWTGAHVDEGSENADPSIRNVLCAVDEKDESIWLIKAAADLADSYSARLHLVRVVPELTVYSPEENIQGQRELIESARLALCELRHDAGVMADVCVDAGRVSEVIRKAAIGLQADLVVIGRGHAERLLGRLRTHAYAIIRESPCPVWSI